MNQIKEWKQLTYVTIKDGRVLITERSPEEIGKAIANNSHIVVEGELHGKFDIINAIPVQIDDVESYILSQNRYIQTKLREKKLRLRNNMGKEMTMSYAQNYVNILIKSNNEEKN